MTLLAIMVWGKLTLGITSLIVTSKIDQLGIQLTYLKY